MFVVAVLLAGQGYAQLNQELLDLIAAAPIKTLPLLDSTSRQTKQHLSILGKEQLTALHLPQLKPAEASNMLDVRIAYRISLFEKYPTVVFSFRDTSYNVFSMLVTYDEQFQPLEHIVLAFDKKGPEVHRRIGYVRQKTLEVQTKKGNGTYYDRYLHAPDGTLRKKLYLEAKQLQEQGHILHQRVVKAHNGLTIRDSLGRRIGRFNYGDPLWVLEYSKDSIALMDDGSKVWGRKAKVVLNYNTFVDELVVPTGVNNFGYVFEGFLFKTGGFHSRYTEYNGSKNDRYHYYYTDYLSLSNYHYNEAPIDIREFMEIEKVDLSEYQDQIIAQEVFSYRNSYRENTKGIKMAFTNGTSRIYKDTTYQESEYSPSDHYELYDNRNWPNYFVLYKSFFEDSQVMLLNKSDGDTVYIFSDYPFSSPDKSIAVSLSVPMTYDEEVASMQITLQKEGQFQSLCMAHFINWNITKNTQIYWISENEFILKAQPTAAAHQRPKNPQYFYLKFTVKV